MKARTTLIASLAATAAIAAAGTAHTNVTLTRISADTFHNTTSQHATEVEPDTFARGSTVMSAFQVGRFFNGGATDIGVSRSTDGGSTWSSTFLPGLTATSGLGGATGSPFERVSDASVAYDASHNTWLLSSIPLTPTTSVPVVTINRSTDSGATWTGPSTIPDPPATNKVDLDKNWTVCDNTTS